MKRNYALVLSFCLLGAFLLYPGIQKAFGQLYINEFLASNDASFPGPQGDYPDWIEIYNAGSTEVMLGGYYFSDDLTDPAKMFQVPSTYPDSVTVPAGGFIVFFANSNPESSVMNLNFKLSGSGEHIGFWNPSQEFVDSLTFGPQTSDISYGRYPDGSEDWFSMTEITPGSANANPGVQWPVLFINEFMASNDNAFPGPEGDYPDWIEIYNPGASDVNLSGYFMSDKLYDTASWFQIPVIYPDSLVVPAGGFLVFYANSHPETSVMNLDFKLSGGGEQIGLWAPDQQVIDTLSYGPQMADTSYGRYPDGSDIWHLMTQFTPGSANIYISGETAVLYINEFMASNDAAIPGPEGDYPDWIEIYNPGSDAVMLGGYYMSDNLTDPAKMYQIPSTYPDSVTVAAGGFIVFYANSSPETSVKNLNFKLSGGGEEIGLWSPDQVFVDSLTYGPQIADTSYGRYPDGSDNWLLMPEFTPGAPNTNTQGIFENVAVIGKIQNYPNPFTDQTSIVFEMQNTANVMIKIYNELGKEVTLLANQRFDAGTHQIIWNAEGLPSGCYYIQMVTEGKLSTGKLLLMKE